MKLIGLVLVLVICMVLILPVAATDSLVMRGNSTCGTVCENDYFHTPSYVPDGYVWAAIVLGLITMIVSAFIPKEINVFVLLTPCFWGYAAWFSAFMVREYVVALPGQTTQISYVEVVYAQPILQYIMFFLFILSVIYAVYLLFLRDVDTAIDGMKDRR